MAYPPIWLTPPGNLGIVPELEYYQFHMDAYTESADPIAFAKISGQLPPGIQVISNVAASTGTLQGIPVSSQATPDENQTYTFTIRAQNINDGSLADRTFNLTITNIAPPIIIPRNVNLGTAFDGTIVDLQLEVVEFIPGATITWTLKNGQLPPGLTLTSTGLISGYIEPIPGAGPSSEPGWDDTAWDELGWQFPQGAVSQTFNWSVEASDGVNYDVSTYTLLVIPRGALTVDSTIPTADENILFAGEKFSVDLTSKHYPIILTTEANFPKERQGGWFATQIQAIDLDQDVLQYSIPSIDSGAFDEQYLPGNSIPYVNSTLSGGFLYSGVFPKTSIVNTAATLELYSGNVITATVGQYIVCLLYTSDAADE